MANIQKDRLLAGLQEKFGRLGRLVDSQSLFSIANDAARIYIRYSKFHDGNRAFFGLRRIDLLQLAGHNSYICFLVDNGLPPILVPYGDFEEVFRGAQTASDGQYKVQLLSARGHLELYVARQGRFNVDAYVGFDLLEKSIDTRELKPVPDLSHAQVQTLLAGIGNFKGYDVWIPACDVGRIEWSLTPTFKLRERIPSGFDEVSHILCEIDVVWVGKGRDSIESLFEVEHSTSIYSGLLRFNDLLLTDPKLSHFSIVSNDSRRSAFARQLYRPTFQRSGLSELTSFLEYANVLQWHSRLLGPQWDGHQHSGKEEGLSGIDFDSNRQRSR